MDKSLKLYMKYYGSKDALIKVNSNSIDDKINFLKLIKEANLGINLFEVDETFTNYEKLSLVNGIVEKTPCIE